MPQEESWRGLGWHRGEFLQHRHMCIMLSARPACPEHALPALHESTSCSTQDLTLPWHPLSQEVSPLSLSPDTRLCPWPQPDCPVARAALLRREKTKKIPLRNTKFLFPAHFHHLQHQPHHHLNNLWWWLHWGSAQKLVTVTVTLPRGPQATMCQHSSLTPSRPTAPHTPGTAAVQLGPVMS